MKIIPILTVISSVLLTGLSCLSPVFANPKPNSNANSLLGTRPLSANPDIRLDSVDIRLFSEKINIPEYAIYERSVNFNEGNGIVLSNNSLIYQRFSPAYGTFGYTIIPADIGGDIPDPSVLQPYTLTILLGEKDYLQPIYQSGDGLLELNLLRF